MPKKKKRETADEHTCTARCLRVTHAFGRSFYYCADTPVVVVRVPR